MSEVKKKKNPLVEMVKTITRTTAATNNQRIDLKNLEEELQRSAERFKTLFNYSNDAIFIIDPNRRCIEEANERACLMLGYAREEFQGLSIFAIHSDQKQAVAAFFQRVLEEGHGWTNELHCLTRDGETLSTEVTAWPIHRDDQTHLLAFVHDISQRKRTEEALRESEKKFRTLIENMQEGVMIVDNDDRIQFVNHRIGEMLGYQEAEMVGKVGYRLLFSPRNQQIIREKNRLRTRKVADQYEIQMRKKSGEEIWVHISGVPIADSDGVVSGSFGIITDINQRKRTEEALRKARDELEKRIQERTVELVESNKSLKREIQERKQAEEERQKFISLVENSNDVIIMASQAGYLLYVNTYGKKVLGLSSEAEVRATKLAECHPPEVRRQIEEMLIPTLINTGMWKGELPLLRGDEKSRIPTLLNAFAVRHPRSGELLALAVIYRDITARKQAEEGLKKAKDELEMRVEERTAELSKANRILREQIAERKRAEEKLQESEERYRLLFNSGNDAVFVYYPSASNDAPHFIEVNDVACQKLDYERAELLKLSPRSIVRRHDEGEAGKRTHKLFSEKHILYEDTFVTKKQNLIPVEISAHLFEFNEKPTVMLIARDITARRRAQEQIQEQAALLDKAQDAILVSDLTDYIIYWNKSAERLYGWSTEEAIGNNGFELLFNNNYTQFIGARRSVLEKGEWQGELRQVTKSGREIIVESRWTLVHGNHDEAKSILIVNTDITEKKKIEAQFLRAQRMESIGALAGGIAHDLNNVLAPILTAVQILEVRFTDEKSQRILHTVESNVKRGADMVKQILTFARGVEGERIPLQVSHFIHDLEKITLETFPRSIDIAIDVPEHLWTVSGDATQLHQVLLNLCVNARDAMPEGGELRISAQNVSLDEEFVRIHLDAKMGNYVMIRVEDSGVGIPEDIITKIFEPFFTTKEAGKGTGLGLSTVIAIVKSHGGFVNVDSERGKGTTFEVYLPAAMEDQFEEMELVESDVPHGNGELILVVDDESSVLEITRETLETYGYNALVAHDGAEAVALYAKHKDSIELVITDMMMPVMDGIATIRALRKINLNVKIIASSGYMEDGKIAQFIGNGVEAFLHKPYTADKLLEALHHQLRK